MTIFGIGPLELLIILIITLIVVGPERLPELMQTVGAWVRRARQMLEDIRAQARAELGEDYDYVEEQVRTLRSLDPRRQIQEMASSILEEPREPTVQRSSSSIVPVSPASPPAAQRHILDLASQALDNMLLDEPLRDSLQHDQQVG